LALAVGALGQGSAASPVQTYLTDNFRFGANEFRDLERRLPVTRTLDTADGREVATVSAIQVRVPAEFYADQLRDIVAFKRNASVLQIGRFGVPARAEDAAGLTLEPDDVDHLRGCRPGACKIQLSAEAIARFRREVPSGTAAPHDAANRTMREVLAGLVNRYRSSGDASLEPYADVDPPTSVATEFARMIASRPAILQRVPVLHDHLVRYPPHDNDAGVNDLIYWSKERMGPAVVVSVTHLAIARIDGAPPLAYAAASKQIYSSHYFDASLGLTIVLRDEAGPESAYLVYANRSRIDALGGIFGGVKRAIVRSRARAAAHGSMVEARDRVERLYRTRVPPGDLPLVRPDEGRRSPNRSVRITPQIRQGRDSE
jgi:hypothetical protein